MIYPINNLNRRTFCEKHPCYPFQLQEIKQEIGLQNVTSFVRYDLFLKLFRKGLLLSLLGISLISNMASYAQQPGDFDPSFNPADLGFGKGDGFNLNVSEIVLQPDGKILVGGSFTSYNSTARKGVARLNADGSLDASFIPNLGVTGDIYVHKLVLQPDGKILVGFYVADASFKLKGILRRLNANGSMDTSFNANGQFDSHILPFVLQPDGKILVGEGFTSSNNVKRKSITRFNSDGSLDESFDTSSGFDSSIFSLALQSDGKILVGGIFNEFNGIVRKHMARLNSNGSLDASFDVGTGFTGGDGPVGAYDILLQPDGKMLVSGDFRLFNGVARRSLVRLNTNGSLDTSLGATFNNADKVVVHFITLHLDGKILAGTENSIIRFNADGSLDTEFASIITQPGGANDAIAIRPDGKILIGGSFTFIDGISRNYIAQLNTDGSLDNSFNLNTGFNNRVNTQVVQPDGKILVGGEFTSFNGMPVSYMVRLHPDGSLDTGFKLGRLFTNQVNTIVLQPDGKILVGGLFQNYNVNDTLSHFIVRLNADGTIDKSFNTDFFNERVQSIVLQPDGKILVGGYFTSIGKKNRRRLARLNTDGSLDESFDPGFSINDRVWPMIIQPDNKIIFGGFFSKGIQAFLGGFNVGTGFNSTVSALALQPDGKILVGGSFTQFNGKAINRIARLNADGSLDTSFDPGTGFNNPVFSFVLEPKGKILVGGAFSSYNGKSYNRIVRLLPNGSVDTDFHVGIGFNNEVRAITPLPDGKILVGGAFTSYKNNGRNRLIRIFGDAPSSLIDSLILVNADTDQDIMPLFEGAVINLGQIGTGNLSVRAVTQDNTVKSMRFSLSGAKNFTKTENIAPYALFGDQNNGQDFIGQLFAPGQYSLTATPYDQPAAQGNAGIDIHYNFSIITGNDLSIDQLMLVNADTDQDIMPLNNGTVVDLSAIGTSNLSVRATTLPYPVGSVRFKLSGLLSENKVETAIPYALFGDQNGGQDFIGKIFTPGQYSLSVTPYTKAYANGTVGTVKTVSFSVIQSQSNSLEVVIYPNTTSNLVTVNLKNASEAQLKVIDRYGQTVYEGIIQDSAQVGFADQSSGTYQMIFQANGQTLTKQVIVLR